MEGQKSMWHSLGKPVLYLFVFVAALIGAGFFIQICNSEKVQVCDLTTGKCDLESQCQPLWEKLGASVGQAL